MQTENSSAKEYRLHSTYNDTDIFVSANSNSLPVYYDCSGKTPVETGAKNLRFYQNFFREWGHSSSYADLWPSNNLLALIKAMKAQYELVNDSDEKKVTKGLIALYERM